MIYIYIYAYIFVSYLAPTIELKNFSYLASGRLMSLGMMGFKLSPLLNPRLVQFCYDVWRVSGEEHLMTPHDGERRQSLGRLHSWWLRKFQLRWRCAALYKDFLQVMLFALALDPNSTSTRFMSYLPWPFSALSQLRICKNSKLRWLRSKKWTKMTIFRVHLMVQSQICSNYLSSETWKP